MNLIKQRRETLGLTQKELASKVGVSIKTVQAWEQGWRAYRRSRIDTLEKLAWILDIDLIDLFKEGKEDEAVHHRKR